MQVSSHKHSSTTIHRDELIKQANLQASQASKLSSFANRPAIDMPLINFVTEVICTFVLVVGVGVIKERSKDLDRVIVAFLIGVYLFALIACLGGTFIHLIV